jgi:hypothetical protein
MTSTPTISTTIRAVNTIHHYDPTGDRKYLEERTTPDLEDNCMTHSIMVQLADKNGHSEMLMSPAETVDLVQQHSESWVFADNQMVQGDQLNEASLATVSNVRILPGLVGG